MRTAIFCIGFGVLTSAIGFTQGTDTRPQFVVASLKPSSPDVPFRMTGGPGTPNPGRWTCVGWSLENFILKAYNLRSYQVSAPEWVKSAMFTVNATMPAGTTREEFRLMQQRLLEERFKIVLHRERREMAIYELVVANGGPKLVEYVETPASGELAKPTSTAAPLDKDGYPIIPGGSGYRVVNGRARAQFKQQTMENLANLLSAQVDRPVIDTTGLKAKYALTLSWYKEPHAVALASPVSGGDPIPSASISDSGPTIFRAIQDQLGLKLDAKKGSIEVLVIDRAERQPAEN